MLSGAIGKKAFSVSKNMQKASLIEVLWRNCEKMPINLDESEKKKREAHRVFASWLPQYSKFPKPTSGRIAKAIWVIWKW